MLIYHPAYDAYHCVFRELFIVDRLKTLDIAKLRILDFFLVFPSEIARMRLPKEHLRSKREHEKAANVYRGPVSYLQTFRDMEHIQLAALRALTAARLLDAQELERGVIQRTSAAIPNALASRFKEIMSTDNPNTSFILDVVGNFPTNGADGLKDRSGLMEHRYDVA